MYQLYTQIILVIY